MFDRPEATKPMFVLELLQLKVDPAGTLWKAAGEIEDPGQTARLLRPVTIGTGLTETT
jgi:hypothetical protein